MPTNANRLDRAGILVAINGVDSSVLDGSDTVASSGDEVSIIPTVHGGAGADSISRLRLTAAGRSFEIFEVRGGSTAGHMYLDKLRQSYPRLTIQGVSSEFVLGALHVQKILYVSLRAQRCGAQLAKGLEMDILMRFACTTQISRAIERAGITSDGDFVIVAVGPTSSLDALHGALQPHLLKRPLTRDRSAFLMKQFQITEKQLGAVGSDSPLEDVLVEAAATLL